MSVQPFSKNNINHELDNVNNTNQHKRRFDQFFEISNSTISNNNNSSEGDLWRPAKRMHLDSTSKKQQIFNTFQPLPDTKLSANNKPLQAITKDSSARKSTNNENSQRKRKASEMQLDENVDTTNYCKKQFRIDNPLLELREVEIPCLSKIIDSEQSMCASERTNDAQCQENKTHQQQNKNSFNSSPTPATSQQLSCESNQIVPHPMSFKSVEFAFPIRPSNTDFLEEFSSHKKFPPYRLPLIKQNSDVDDDSDDESFFLQYQNLRRNPIPTEDEDSEPKIVEINDAQEQKILEEMELKKLERQVDNMQVDD